MLIVTRETAIGPRVLVAAVGSQIVIDIAIRCLAVLGLGLVVTKLVALSNDVVIIVIAELDILV
jgi:hypothetical protein